MLAWAERRSDFRRQELGLQADPHQPLQRRRAHLKVRPLAQGGVAGALVAAAARQLDRIAAKNVATT